MKEKICTKCNLSLPLNEFYKNSFGGYRSMCKECYKAYTNVYREKNPEKVKEWDKTSKEKLLADPVRYAKYKKAVSAWAKKQPKEKLKGYYSNYKQKKIDSYIEEIKNGGFLLEKLILRPGGVAFAYYLQNNEGEIFKKINRSTADLIFPSVEEKKRDWEYVYYQ